MTIRTSGGDVETEGVRNVGAIETSGGDVSVIGSAESLRAKTSGGNISVVGAGGSVNAESSVARPYSRVNLSGGKRTGSNRR